MKIHKARKNPLFSPVAVILLFAAVFSYIGSWIFKDAGNETELYEVRALNFKDSCCLKGIAVRREQLICSRLSSDKLPESGTRLRAGSVIADVSLISSGLFFNDSDGFEFLSPEQLSGLSPSKLEELIKLRPDRKYNSPGRIVYGHCWYYAACAPSSLPLSCSEEYPLWFSGADEACAADLIYKSPDEGGKCVLIFRLTDENEKFLKLRKAEAELVFSQYSGLQLPPDALRENSEGDNFVYTLTSGRIVPAAVEIIYKNGELCIASFPEKSDDLREGSLVIVSQNKDVGSAENEHSRKCCAYKKQH